MCQIWLTFSLHNIQDGGLSTFWYNLCETLKSNLLLKIVKCGTAFTLNNSMLHKHTYSFFLGMSTDGRIIESSRNLSH